MTSIAIATSGRSPCAAAIAPWAPSSSCAAATTATCRPLGAPQRLERDVDAGAVVQRPRRHAARSRARPAARRAPSGPRSRPASAPPPHPGRRCRRRAAPTRPSRCPSPCARSRRGRCRPSSGSRRAGRRRRSRASGRAGARRSAPSSAMCATAAPITSRWAKSASSGPSPRRRATRFPTESVSTSAMSPTASRTTSKARCSCPDGPCARRSASRSSGTAIAGSLGLPLRSPDREHPDRPADPARRLPAAARGRGGELPARVGRAGPARAPLLHRLRLAARLVRGGGSARRAGRRLPRLRPRREARADGAAPRRRPGAPGEPLRRRRDARPLRPRQRHGRGAGGRPRTRSPPGSRRELVFQKHKLPSQRSTMRRTPDQATYEQGVRADPRVHPRRRRVPGRALAARRAADVRLGARALPRAAPRQPVALPLPARARRPRADRLARRRRSSSARTAARA